MNCSLSGCIVTPMDVWGHVPQVFYVHSWRESFVIILPVVFKICYIDIWIIRKACWVLYIRRWTWIRIQSNIRWLWQSFIIASQKWKAATFFWIGVICFLCLFDFLFTLSNSKIAVHMHQWIESAHEFYDLFCQQTLSVHRQAMHKCISSVGANDTDVIVQVSFLIVLEMFLCIFSGISISRLCIWMFFKVLQWQNRSWLAEMDRIFIAIHRDNWTKGVLWCYWRA